MRVLNPKEKALKLPQSPGVYIMMDDKHRVIYVGKAKKLYNRVNSYFRSNSSHNLKTRLMVSQIRDFDYIITDSEIEAFVLENSLIKKHMPKYNILLKDDKGYPFIRVSLKEEYPRFSIVAKREDDGAEYFGPYGGRVESRRAIETVSELLRLPTCSRKFPKDIGKGRPCLNSHIGRCDAVCAGNVTKEEYREKIEQASMILSGKTDSVIDVLEKRMLDHAEKLEFERAGKIRDQIHSIKSLATKQKMISSMLSDTDIIGFFVGESKTYFSILHYIDGALLEGETKETETPVYGEVPEILEEFMLRYYTARGSFPKEIYIQTEIPSAEIISELFSEEAGRRVHIISPKRGEKLKLVKMAENNAKEKALSETDKEEKRARILGDIKKVLGLEREPMRIEAYDISNTSGKEMVGGMVVLKNGAFLKRDYRRFRIKTLTDQDDPRAMSEVLRRRFLRLRADDEKFSTMPDLILLDGGINQLREVLKLFDELSISVPLFGMVKDDKHMTRAIVDADGREIGISGNPALFRFISTLQDEVHRYSIEYHRKLRERSMTESELTKIEGIGKSRAEKLLEKFKSIGAIKKAEVDELITVLPENAAKKVYEYYHGEED